MAGFGKIIIALALVVAGAFLSFTGVGLVVGLPLILISSALFMAGIGEMGFKSARAVAKGAAKATTGKPAPATQGTQLPGPSHEFKSKWAQLSRYDPEISSAVAHLSGYGNEAVMRFRDIYADVNNKEAIPGILDVPDEATSIHYGFFLQGYGRVWARGFHLDIAGSDALTTKGSDTYLPKPVNLDFSQSA